MLRPGGSFYSDPKYLSPNALASFSALSIDIFTSIRTTAPT